MNFDNPNKKTRLIYDARIIILNLFKILKTFKPPHILEILTLFIFDPDGLVIGADGTSAFF